MRMIGNLSERNFKGMVSNNLITNCSISTDNIAKTRTIFGPDFASVRGNTAHSWTPEPVVADYVAVARSVIEKNKVAPMTADVFLVDGVAVLLTVSRQIKLITAKHVTTYIAKGLTKYLECVLEFYLHVWFNMLNGWGILKNAKGVVHCCVLHNGCQGTYEQDQESHLHNQRKNKRNCGDATI
jgi:hypothetical protein